MDNKLPEKPKGDNINQSGSFGVGSNSGEIKTKTLSGNVNKQYNIEAKLGIPLIIIIAVIFGSAALSRTPFLGNLILGQESLAFDVSVSNKPLEESDEFPDTSPDDPELALSYQVTEVNDLIQITPQIPYLSKIENGEPVSGIDENLGEPPFFKWQFPNLDLKFVNNTEETVYITDILLEVEESKTDPSAVLVVTGQDPNLLHFELVNEGWGEVKNLSVKYNLAPVGQPISFDKPYKYETQLGEFSERQGYSHSVYYHSVNVSEALEDMGVDINTLDYQYHSESEAFSNPWVYDSTDSGCWSQLFGSEPKSAFCQSKLDALGVFSESRHPEEHVPQYIAIVYGEISFTETTIEGKTREHTIKFKTEVVLIDGGQYGAPGPPTYQYEAKLDVDRKNYTIQVQKDGETVSQYLKPGDIDRFNILIGAEKSSVHTLRLRLIYNDGKSRLSDPISLEIFVPRSEARALEPVSKPVH